MRIDVLTLFPEMFPAVLGASILKRAAEAGCASYHLHDIRTYTQDKHGKVDRPPYGGGPGMVIQCQPVWDAVMAVEAIEPDVKPLRLVMTPQGERLTQGRVEQFAALPRVMILCGHYEGFDERVLDRLRDEGGLTPVSIGDYVLSGGEIAAMALIDAMVRLLPGVVGDEQSIVHESFSPALNRGMDYPHYTRPEVWADRKVPDVLLSGHHAQIDAWRMEQSRIRSKV